MGLNKSKGNMYEFVTHTWNTIKGKCPHDCSYCYMKRWGNLKDVRFDQSELKTNLGADNIIFVGSSCDMFARKVPYMWIFETLDHCNHFSGNQYLFQTKNPSRITEFLQNIMDLEPIICTTIESNRWYPDIMADSPSIENRVNAMQLITEFRKFVTIEPILDFDINQLVEMIKKIEPEQVNIGADSGNNDLPEPSFQKILELSERLLEFTKIEYKRNLSRLA